MSITTAMILAAGRGERLRPLTDSTPKPLIEVAGKHLIEYHIESLARAGITSIVINTSWLSEQIHQALGDGSAYGVTIQYSDEPEALETAGGIIQALPLLGETFIVINGDIWTDFDFSVWREMDVETEAHLLLVNNPDHNPAGDFALKDGMLVNSGATMYTYSGIGIYTAEFFRRHSTRQKSHWRRLFGKKMMQTWLAQIFFPASGWMWVMFSAYSN